MVYVEGMEVTNETNHFLGMCICIAEMLIANCIGLSPKMAYVL